MRGIARRVLRDLLHYRRRLALYGGVLVVAALAGLGAPMLTKILIDDGLARSDTRTVVGAGLLALAFLARSQSGAVISRVSGDVIEAQGLIQATFGSVVSNVVALVAAAFRDAVRGGGPTFAVAIADPRRPRHAAPRPRSTGRRADGRRQDDVDSARLPPL